MANMRFSDNSSAALAYKFLDDFRKDKRLNNLPFNVQTWLHNIASAQREQETTAQAKSAKHAGGKPPSRQSSPKYEIIFALEINGHGASFSNWLDSRLYPFFARRKKDGTMGSSTTSFSFANCLKDKRDFQQARYEGIEEKDRELIFAMIMSQDGDARYIKDHIMIRNFKAEEILLRLVEGKRCRLGIPTYGTPSVFLSHGQPRKLRFQWRTNADGSVAPMLEVDDCTSPTLFRLPSGIWYCDKATGEIGKTESEIPQKTLELFASAPTIPLVHLDTVMEQIEILDRKSIVPRIEKKKDIVVKKATFKPVLILENISTKHLPYDYLLTHMGPSTLPVARMALNCHLPDGTTFLIDLVTLLRDSPQNINNNEITIAKDNTVYRIARNKNLEREYCQVPLDLCEFDELRTRNIADYIEKRRFKRGKDTFAYCFMNLDPEVLSKLASGALYDWSDIGRWINFLTHGRTLLEQQGWEIRIEPSFEYNIADATDWHCDLEESEWGWFDFGLTVKVDGEEIDLVSRLSQWLKDDLKSIDIAALKNAEPEECILLPLDKTDKLLPFPKQRLYLLMQTLVELFDTTALTKTGKLKLSRFNLAGVTDLEALTQDSLQWTKASSLTELQQRLTQHQSPEIVEPPSWFTATLRPYQHHGLNWLNYLRQLGVGGILADDMGLGKTVQTLALLAREKAEGRMTKPSLIICPKSVVANWVSEATKFAPELRVGEAMGINRQQVYDNAQDYDLIVTNYVLIGIDNKQLSKLDLYYLIMDEAQALKNPKTLTASATRSLKADYRLCLSGTPLENHLGELWAVFNQIMPGLLGSHQAFRSIFRTPIENYGDSVRRDALIKRISPFLLRRRKSEIELDLPEKTEIVKYIDVEGDQRDLYESIRATMSKKVRDEVKRRGLAKSHIMILDALLKLRQVCNDPQLLKLPAAKEIKTSAKMDLLRELLPQLIDEGRKIILFSQFVEMLKLIEKEVTTLGIPYSILTGSTNNRGELISRFQNDPALPLMLISLKAGGSGINLTAADTVIHYDPWWNPAVEAQATDRTHRIGQTKPVFIYKFITRSTVEETMLSMQQRKRSIFDGMLDEGDNYGGSITSDDIDVIFKPLDVS